MHTYPYAFQTPFDSKTATRADDVVQGRAVPTDGPHTVTPISPSIPITAPTPPTPTPAPSASMAAAQAWARVTDIRKAAIQAQASLAKQSVDLSWATLAGNLDRTSLNKAYLESVTRESARYWRDVGKLGIDCAYNLVALGKIVSTTVLREIATAGGRPRNTAGAPDNDPPERRGAEVSLSGPVGGRAEGGITVVNRHPGPRRIQLSTSDVVDSLGAVVGAEMDISPTTVTVPSGEERPVSLGVDLTDARFSAANEYSCTVEVSGGDEASIEVYIQVGD